MLDLLQSAVAPADDVEYRTDNASLPTDINSDHNDTYPVLRQSNGDNESQLSGLDNPNNGIAPKLPAAHKVPVEVLQQIYYHLGPKDFNSARHTCRNWMYSSLNGNLLRTMLRRGGWVAWDYEASGHDHPWSISKRLSRECALLFDWSGNGLDKDPIFTESSSTDFSQLDRPCSSHSPPSELIFTTSICGDYMLVARDTRIFVYGLVSRYPTPVTSIVCPRKVLSTSMNASASRCTVAALLQGRMGIVCEIQPATDTDESPVKVAVERDEEMSVELSHSVSSVGSDDDSDHVDDSISTIHVRSDTNELYLTGLRDVRTHERNLIHQTWPLKLRGSLKNASQDMCARHVWVENGVSTIYRHLFSEDDPPRSVAISPHHHCVAFGSSSSIETHWDDPITGQSMCHWFPLTESSDYLHFLEPRMGLDTEREIRLISSPAHTFRSAYSRDRSVSYLRPSGSRMLDHDYYQAVPLSDGHHQLYFNPTTSLLTLGHIHTTQWGLTEILRKVIFAPAKDGCPPSTYVSGWEMTWGARIAVAYGDTIIMYSIPPDVLDVSCFEHDPEGSRRSEMLNGREAARSEWLDWHEDSPACKRTDGIWPLVSQGTEVGKLQGVCELAVTVKTEEFIVWGFSKTGQCKSWSINRHDDAEERVVCRGGLVHEMHEKIENYPPGIEQSDFAYDGLKKETGALAVERDGDVEDTDVRRCLDAWYDEDGDVVKYGEVEIEVDSQADDWDMDEERSWE